MPKCLGFEKLTSSEREMKEDKKREAHEWKSDTLAADFLSLYIQLVAFTIAVVAVHFVTDTLWSFYGQVQMIVRMTTAVGAADCGMHNGSRFLRRVKI